jgi:hypothetical protein
MITRRLMYIGAVGAGAIAIVLVLRLSGKLQPQDVRSSPLPLRQEDAMADSTIDETKPLARLEFDAAVLVREHPPRLTNANKKAVCAAASSGPAPAGKIIFTRWPERRLPVAVNATHTETESFADIFQYAPAAAGCVEWHLNFADPNLFFAYGGPLFAQDEIQVAEHPALASVREALNAKEVTCYTTSKNRPTPVLVAGVERRLSINTAGIYGNNFSHAPAATIQRAITVLNPPTISNILAIAAPACGSGRYERAEIELILATAYTGFRAAVEESQRLSPGCKVVIHTGHWGCGAFGGNKQLMSILQILAANLAQVDKLVFHAFDSAGRQAFDAGEQLLQKEFLRSGTSLPMEDLLAKLQQHGFKWGVSDGN